MTTGNYSTGEALELHRRRADLTQGALAALLGVPVSRVRQWERDEVTRHPAPVCRVGELAPHEWCWLARRRAGVTLRELSGATGLAVSWLHRAETGQCGAGVATLVTYWELQA